MDSVMERYRFWSTDPYFDADTRAELVALHDHPAEIEDRFYKDLEFGTAGLRGVIGAGTNRMNRYTVRLATRGLADSVAALGPEACHRGVVIAHDPRHFSPEFAREAALVLAARGIRSFLWDSLRPTPMLSFGVRRLGAIAGIMITASHNPPAYNGYKVYWEDGGQVPPERAAEILARVRAIGDIRTVVPMGEDKARGEGLLQDVPEFVDLDYLDRLRSLATDPGLDRSGCRLLYSPLHGTGNLPVRRVLTEVGYRISVVPEQALPDPNFSTVKYPNPEDAEVFTLALKQAEREQPDVIMASDPDADRLGLLARDAAGEYRLLSGNQIGALLTEFILRHRKEQGDLPADGVVIKSIASTNLVAPICQAYGVKLMEVHTGFKFIGDKIREFEERGSGTFLFGFEESYGYLAAPFVRDKDAVMAALMVAEATAYHRAQGRTLYEALERIWRQYGYFQEGVHNVTLPGKDGVQRMKALMADLRANPPKAFGELAVAFVDDYAAGTSTSATGEVGPLALGQADVLHYRFADGGFVMVRPSGTEPKLKVYVSVKGKDLPDAQRLLTQVMQAALARMGLA